MVLVTWSLAVPEIAVASPISEQIRDIVSTTEDAEANIAQGTVLDAAVLLPKLYAFREYRPAWNKKGSADALFAELSKGVAQGFQPADFHLPELLEMHEKAKTGGAWEQAIFDVVATDAAIKLTNYLVFGKVDPGALDSDWNFSKPVIQRDPVQALNEYLDDAGFSALMELINIENGQYQSLIGALKKYRTFASSGGWPEVPSDTVLKPGASEPAVAILRQRLAAEGVLNQGRILPSSSEPEEDPSWLYDERLENDVKAFQARHGLNADGVVGAKTFASLNRSAQDRVNQIRLSLERGRWLFRDEEEEYILVNIAGARTYLVKADGSLWTTRSITGTEYRKTPVFRDKIQYMEFNPTWTVPASIFRKDKLARIRNDPGYLDRNNYIVRNSAGKTIPASSVNWGAKNPGVTLVQTPGPHNALGLVKFMFPNKYAVYLHDTNDRSLFDRNERNLSSGCVRVEYPFELAGLLMEGDPEWSSARMQAILDGGKTVRINLPKPMPVLLTYWTAWVENQEVHFREDPYGRDTKILTALDQ
ncbi:Murein L,D-transpeptidase YcbB/YkuD [Shimia gijangensis]|uniref:Murein L,D-transpeptidase YcbB/YkuD n=1 Tax=Shimia gijangensis TaxID=1470563 RepID=A0A1M6SFF5_9RHOB|nr:L,D-transpeptidase family protein [Shimia gijangensis]SHK43482.1 Murein L,D-transpeptidase YcbB/YkuD [Shimia gijangensis]